MITIEAAVAVVAVAGPGRQDSQVISRSEFTWPGASWCSAATE